jgi:hypothetical protein
MKKLTGKLMKNLMEKLMQLKLSKIQKVVQRNLLFIFLLIKNVLFFILGNGSEKEVLLFKSCGNCKRLNKNDQSVCTTCNKSLCH